MSGPRFVAITTVHDWGAAQVAREKLADAGIPVELKSLGMNPYFGAVTAQEIEVRVPPEHAPQAELELERLQAQVEASLIAESGAPLDDDEEADDDEARAARRSTALPTSERRPLKVSWAIVLALLPVIPFPAGCFYARATRLGWGLLGCYVGGFALMFLRPEFALLTVGAKLADLVLAPFMVLAYNARLEDAAAQSKKEPHGAQP